MRAAALLAFSLCALPALSGTAGAQEQARYAACLAGTAAQTDEAVVEAYEDALAWESQGGGAPAEHCAAIALLRLGHEEEAATRLEALTGESLFAAPDQRAELLRQAASAWLLAGELARADAAAARALEQTPDAPDLLLLRAQVTLEGGDYARAQADLTRALAASPGDADMLILRAHAHMGLGDLDAALRDAEAAVAADPQSVDARLALGDVREAMRESGAAGR